MGNSKQARYNRIGATPHHANNSLHLNMTSAPSSTAGRTFRTPFIFNKGLMPSSQNDLRFKYRTLTPDIRRRLWGGGGRSYESMKPLPPEFEDWVRFKRNNLLNPLFSNDLSLADPFVHLWDASKGQFVSWDSTASDLSSRVFTVTYGTPYEYFDHNHANLQFKNQQKKITTDFCGNALDSSYLVPDQAFAVRLRFDSATFVSDLNDFHFIETVNKYGGVHAARDPKNYDVSSHMILKNGSRIPMSVDLSATLGQRSGQGVDVSFGPTEWNYFTSTSPSLLLRELQEGDFIINPRVTQRSKRTGAYIPDPTAQPSVTRIDVSNSLEGGIFVYTPPYMVVDASMMNGSVHVGGKPNLSKPPGAGSRNATHRYPMLNYPASASTLSDMSALIILDTSYSTCGINMTLNHAFPSNVRKDWIESVKYSFKEAPDWDSVVDAKSVRDLSIGQNPATLGYDRLMFNIRNTDLVPMTSQSYSYFWLRTELIIPKTCKQIAGSNRKTIYFTMDFSANLVHNSDLEITGVYFKRDHNVLGSLSHKIFPP